MKFKEKQMSRRFRELIGVAPKAAPTPAPAPVEVEESPILDEDTSNHEEWIEEEQSEEGGEG